LVVKAWIDMVAREKLSTTPKTVCVGLAKDKKAPGIGFPWRVHQWSLEAEEFREAGLRTVLAIIGMESVQTHRWRVRIFPYL
jgi:FMN-dependent NADH-azoreductase